MYKAFRIIKVLWVETIKAKTITINLQKTSSKSPHNHNIVSYELAGGWKATTDKQTQAHLRLRSSNPFEVSKTETEKHWCMTDVYEYENLKVL